MQTTLCYIKKDGNYLMLHRTKKKKDCSKEKWIGVGGHFEEGESPEECLLREVKEETGYTLTSYQYRAVITFVYGEEEAEYMSLFTADGFEGKEISCDEGDLEWIPMEQIWNLNLWEGDKIFFCLLEETDRFFSLKLVYDTNGVLKKAVLDGKPMELFDVLREDGTKSGVVSERTVVHRRGLLHATVHTWIVRKQKPGSEKSGYDVLLQKRSACKDSNPGNYDISSAGHVEAGTAPLEAALRELKEELGIEAAPEELISVGIHRGSFDAEFHGRMFHDREWSSVYLYRGEIEEKDLVLQEEEVESVLWMDYEECREKIQKGLIENCIYEDEFAMVGEVLRNRI